MGRRLLVTVERYAPAIGGAERVAQRIAEGLSVRGWEAHVLTTGPVRDEVLNGVEVHRRPLSGNEARGIEGDRAEVLRLADRIAPDVVFNYAAQSWTTDVFAPWLPMAQRPRMVLAPCGFSGLRDRRYAAYFEAMPQRLRSYDAIVLHSTIYQDAAFVREAGVDDAVVIPNGADPPSDGAGLRAMMPAGRVAVTVGSHVLSKGHPDFVRAVGRLGRRHALVGAIVAPPRRGLDGLRGCQWLCRTHAALRPGTIRVIDGSTPGNAAAAVAAADVFLFASRIECAPLVILEAMAAGTPWVSYDVGNVRELSGGIVETCLDGLVRAADGVLGGRHPGLGEQGRAAWRERHTWPQIVDRYERLLRSLGSAPVI